MPHRRSILIAALLALATASGAWAERERDRPMRDHYQQQRRDDRLQQPMPHRRMLPQGGFIQSDGFIHRDRRYRDDRDDDRGRRDYQQNRRDYGQNHEQNNGRYPPATQRPQRTVNDVIREVEGRYGGKVVGVQTVQSASGPAYRVRVLQRDGRVKTMVVPGN